MRCAISRNDRRIVDLVRLLDRDDVPFAATWREVAAAAERLHARRPSYAHVRRVARLERRLRELQRESTAVLTDAAAGFAAGRVPSFVGVLVRLRELELERELVLQKHKPFNGGG
jgi:hypothetical protein